MGFAIEEGNVGLAFFSSGCNQSNLSTIPVAKLLKFLIGKKKWTTKGLKDSRPGQFLENLFKFLFFTL